jgi:hypothetical protein
MINRFLRSGLLVLTLLPVAGQTADLIYTNNGLITFPPQIDAITVINNGTFDFSANPTALPFDTSDTQNFTNNGTMFGSIGFRFDNAPASAGVRKPSANFRNRLAGRITAVDNDIRIFFLSDGQPVRTALQDSSQLIVNATNIVNEGTLIAGGAGLLRLVGTNVNLARSGVEIEPIAALGSGLIFTNYFIPDVAIYDVLWGQTNQVSDSSRIITGRPGNILVSSPPSDVQGPFFGGFGLNGITFFNTLTIRLLNPVGAFHTQTLAMTNIMYTNSTGAAVSTNVPTTNVVQAVFVGLPATGNVDWDVRFTDSDDFNNPMKTVSVRLSLTQSNVVTVSQDAVSIYLVDTLASATNRGLVTNFTATAHQRPANYTLERLEPFEYAIGVPGEGEFGPISTNLLYQPDFASRIVTNDYAAYVAFIDNIASRPPDIAAGSITNLPGRIEVLADTLDLTRTRFRANGLLDIRAKHLISSSNTVVDAENLSFNLATTNGFLKFENLTRETASRIRGTNYVWSGLWTNYENLIISNYVQNATDTNKYDPAFITNVVTFYEYAMVYDNSQILSEVPVIVNTLATSSTNVVINDRMTVVQSLLIDAISFTLNGSITLSNTYFFNNHGDVVIISLNDWVGTNAPHMKFFTNNGTLNIPSEGHFGDDLTTPYSAFVNNGTITSFGQTIKSDYVELNGQNNASANISVTAASAKIQGSLNAGADVEFFAGDLRFLHAGISAGSRLDLTVTNTLSDAGGSSGNSFTVHDGFRLLRKPNSGDLLGTTINSIAPAFAEVDHVWAANDLGPSSAGFQNNAALGRLILTPGQFEASFPPLFFFAGTGGGNALYVDQLDLSNLADYQNEIAINPDLVIYYASAKLNFTPPLTNGAAQLPEEYLDGQFGGHLRWVRDFAGPNSSVAVIQNGTSILVNRAFRESLIIDSDGDGVPNGLDFFPFDSSLVAKLALAKPPMTAVLSWNGKANKVYSVEAASNNVSPVWTRVMYYTNSASNGTVTVQIPVPAGSPRQFYRVGTSN